MRFDDSWVIDQTDELGLSVDFVNLGAISQKKTGILSFLDKYRYVFFSFIFWFPPFHELGHVILCFLTGSKVVSVDWWCVVYHIPTGYDFVHLLWEFSVFIPLIVVVYYTYVNCKHHVIKKS